MAPNALLVPRAPNVSVCSTPECIKTAQDILADIDLNVDPCSDFYQYTCGSWINNTTLPNDRISAGAVDNLLDRTNDVMRGILEGTYEDLYKNLSGSDKGFHTADEAEDDKKNFETMQEYYNLCLDENTLNNLGSTPIYPDIALIENELFTVNDSTKLLSGDTSASVTQAIALLQRNAIGALATLTVYADDKNPDINVIWVDQGTLSMPSKEYYTIPSNIDHLRAGLNNILFKTIGEYTNGTAQDSEFRASESNRTGFKRWNQDKIMSAIERFIDFETKIANIQLSAAEKQSRVATYNPVALSDFQSRNLIIDWTTIFNSLIVKDGVKVEANTTLIIRAPTYFQDLNDLLSTNVTLQTLQEYLIIQYIGTKIQNLDAVSRAALRDMNGKISSGITAATERWRDCVTDTSTSFPNTMGRYYVLKNFGGEAERKKVETLITTIHQEWLYKLEIIDWLDNQTRAKAIEKVNLITHKAAYSTVSPDLRKPSAIKDYNKGLAVNKTSFYVSKTNAAIFNVEKIFEKAGQKLNKEEWLLSAQTVNAYYVPNSNEIAILGGILQSPFYSSAETLQYLTYGGIGMIIGHELTHAFDSNGKAFDGHGRMVDWWTNATAAKFEENSQCFIDQYSKFTVTGTGNKTFNVDGKLTLSENIADTGGLITSYMAYQRSQAKKTTTSSQRLQGLEQLSPEALFFVNYARIWCTKQREQLAEQLIYIDPHSPSNGRVNGAVQNNQDFATVFNCPVGSPMNPEKRCKMW